MPEMRSEKLLNCTRRVSEAGAGTSTHLEAIGAAARVELLHAVLLLRAHRGQVSADGARRGRRRCRDFLTPAGAVDTNRQLCVESREAAFRRTRPARRRHDAVASGVHVLARPLQRLQPAHHRTGSSILRLCSPLPALTDSAPCALSFLTLSFVSIFRANSLLCLVI